MNDPHSSLGLRIPHPEVDKITYKLLLIRLEKCFQHNIHACTHCTESQCERYKKYLTINNYFQKTR